MIRPLLVQVYFRPFELRLLNGLELLSLTVTFITMIGSQLFWQYDNIDGLLTVILVGFNGARSRPHQSPCPLFEMDPQLVRCRAGRSSFPSAALPIELF